MIAALFNSSEMSLVITFSTCSKNNCSYFFVNSSVNIGFGRTVVGVVGGLNIRGIVLYCKILRWYCIDCSNSFLF